MPATYERIPNRNLSGPELAAIIIKDVQDIISRDGMFNLNISYGRVSYEVRISLHMDNPIYPQHITTVLSKGPSVQEAAASPQLTALEPPPLKAPLTEGEAVSSTEKHRVIMSPNMSRIENDMPLIQSVRDPQLGPVDKEVKYTGDKPDPASVGNATTEKDTTEQQRATWGLPKKGAKK